MLAAAIDRAPSLEPEETADPVMENHRNDDNLAICGSQRTDQAES